MPVSLLSQHLNNQQATALGYRRLSLVRFCKKSYIFALGFLSLLAGTMMQPVEERRDVTWRDRHLSPIYVPFVGHKGGRHRETNGWENKGLEDKAQLGGKG